MIIFTVSASQRDSSSSKDNNPSAYGKNAIDLDAFKIGPYFDKAASKNVTALLGKTAYLNCRVKNLGNKTVSTCLFVTHIFKKKVCSFFDFVFGKIH